MLRLAKEHEAAIRDHGRRAYPDEACGALLGAAAGGEKTVVATVEAGNVFGDVEGFRGGEAESRANRFLIEPRRVLEIEREARARGLDVIGWYHSHPDHPARPSPYDRDHAWPWLSTVIVRVAGGSDEDLHAFVLRDDRTAFDPEPIAR